MTEDVKRLANYLRDHTCDNCRNWSSIENKCFYQHPCLKKKVSNAVLSVVAELEQVKRERDAAVEDLLYAGSLNGEFCSICRYSEHESCEKRKFQHEHCWQWRGVQENERRINDD